MLEKILMGLVVGVLQFMASRKDLKDAAKAEVYRDLQAQAQRAFEWERDAAGGGAELRVQPGAPPIELQCGGSNPDRNPTVPPV